MEMNLMLTPLVCGDELFGGDGNDDLVGDAANLDAAYHGMDYPLGSGVLIAGLLKSRRWRDGGEVDYALNDNDWRTAA